MQDFDLFFLLVLGAPIGLLLALLQLRKHRKSLLNSRFGVAVWNLVLLMFLLSSIFLFAESYYRFFVDTTDSFALNKVTRRWAKRHYRKNNVGVRDNIDYSYLVEPGKRRLTIIGDSFTAGHGVKNVDERFGNLLREQFPSIEVHVLGTNGFETIDELERLTKIVNEGYQLDLVLLVYCLNDISYLVEQSQQVYKQMSEFDESLGYLARNSYFLNTFAFRMMARSNPNVTDYYHFLKGSYSGKTWKTHQNVLKNLNSLVDRNDGSLAVATVPFLHNLKQYEFSDAHKTLNAFWDSEGVGNLDLLPVLQLKESASLVVNEYDAHPNENAHQLIAKSLKPFIVEQLELTAK